MSLAVRVIPCLDVDGGRVVKGINFQDLRDAGDPVELARTYDAEGADELTFLDISASHEGRATTMQVVADELGITRRTMYRYHPTVEDLSAYLHERDLPLYGVDNLPGSAHLETLAVPREVCFLFGQEGPGLSPAAREACDATFSIAQFGSTRSINASAAAAIAMHTWVVQHADLSHVDTWRG